MTGLQFWILATMVFFAIKLFIWMLNNRIKTKVYEETPQNKFKPKRADVHYQIKQTLVEEYAYGTTHLN